MIYIAMPYTGGFKEKLFAEVVEALIKANLNPVSPLLNAFLKPHLTDVSVLNNHDYWVSYSLTLLKSCDIFLLVDYGPQHDLASFKSKGIQVEKRFALENDKFFIYYHADKDLKDAVDLATYMTNLIKKRTGG